MSTKPPVAPLTDEQIRRAFERAYPNAVGKWTFVGGMYYDPEVAALHRAFREGIDALARLSEARPAPDLPAEVLAWRDAKLAEVAALETYNARVKYARERDEVDGFGHTDVNTEWQAWCRAGNAAHAALKAMVGPLFAALSGHST